MDQLKKSLTNWSCNINHQLKWCFSMGNARLGSTLKICCWCLQPAFHFKLWCMSGGCPTGWNATKGPPNITNSVRWTSLFHPFINESDVRIVNLAMTPDICRTLSNNGQSQWVPMVWSAMICSLHLSATSACGEAKPESWKRLRTAYWHGESCNEQTGVGPERGYTTLVCFGRENSDTPLEFVTA